MGEIRRGNEAIQALQKDVEACRGKLQSKNEVIRRQEALVVELRGRVAEMTRAEGKLRDAAAVDEQRRELLERELKTAQASVAEGGDIIQKNQEVINHLNEMINSLQLGGGGGSAWASPGVRPRSEGHFSYQPAAAGEPGPEASLDRLYASPEAHLPPREQKNRHPNKVSPDSVTLGPAHDDDAHHALSGHFSSSKQHHQRLSLSPQQSTGKDAPSPGYYDGVLDPRLLAPHSKNTPLHPARITGITRSDRQQKNTAYSWQLDDFGREGE